MGLSAFPDEERVSFDKIMSGESNKNIIKPSVESGSTNNSGSRKVKNDKTRDGMTDTRGSTVGMTGARGSYADVVRIPKHREIVRRKLSIDLPSSEDQALSRSSEQSLSKLIKI